MNFGEYEGKNWGSLDEEIKKTIFTKEFRTKTGEDWRIVEQRVTSYLRENMRENGKYLVYTHGGVINTLLEGVFELEIYPNCSVIAASFNESTFKADSKIFEWKFNL